MDLNAELARQPSAKTGNTQALCRIEQAACRANMGVGGRATPRSVAEKSAGFVKRGRPDAEMTERMQTAAGTVGIIPYNPNSLSRFRILFASYPSRSCKIAPPRQPGRCEPGVTGAAFGRQTAKICPEHAAPRNTPPLSPSSPANDEQRRAKTGKDGQG